MLIFRLWLPWLEDNFTCFKTKCKTLRIWGAVKSYDSSIEFLLISHLIRIRFEDFEVMVKRSCNVSWSLGNKFHISDYFFIITSFKQWFTRSYIPDGNFISTTNYEVKFWWIKIHWLNLFFMYKLKLCFFMNSEIE